MLSKKAFRRLAGAQKVDMNDGCDTWIFQRRRTNGIKLLNVISNALPYDGSFLSHKECIYEQIASDMNTPDRLIEASLVYPTIIFSGRPRWMLYDIIRVKDYYKTYDEYPDTKKKW